MQNCHKTIIKQYFTTIGCVQIPQVYFKLYAFYLRAFQVFQSTNNLFEFYFSRYKNLTLSIVWENLLGFRENLVKAV